MNALPCITDLAQRDIDFTEDQSAREDEALAELMAEPKVIEQWIAEDGPDIEGLLAMVLAEGIPTSNSEADDDLANRLSDAREQLIGDFEAYAHRRGLVARRIREWRDDLPDSLS